jgi:hypothetical protein
VERPRWEVAEILRRFLPSYREEYGGLSADQARVVRALTACRTAVLGGHVEVCERCGERQITYNACRDRPCPKCRAAATARWLERERQSLLPVPYSHGIFTLPHTLAPLLLQNPRVGYGLFFRAVTETLQQIAADPRHLGARIGFVLLLHTWGQTLTHHPHLHALVPAGGLAEGGRRWVSCRNGYFLSVEVLGTLLRGKYLALLQESFRAGRLVFHGPLERCRESAAFAHLLQEARKTKWVVYAKAPFGGAERVLKYLARYTHRIAISNARLLEVDEQGVAFTYKDYARSDREETMRLCGVELVRRFLLHVLPKGFVRIRRYGILATAEREKSLAHCRQLLGGGASATLAQVPSERAAEGAELQEGGRDESVESGKPKRCPLCGEGRLLWIAEVAPLRGRWSRAPPRRRRLPS